MRLHVQLVREGQAFPLLSGYFKSGSGLFNVGGRRRTIALAAAAVVGAARPFYVVVEDG